MNYFTGLWSHLYFLKWLICLIVLEYLFLTLTSCIVLFYVWLYKLKRKKKKNVESVYASDLSDFTSYNTEPRGICLISSWFSKAAFSSEESLAWALPGGQGPTQHYWIINKQKCVFSWADPWCFFSSHFPGQTNGQLEPCILCNGLYICRVSYFNHCHGSRNWCFKIKLKLESGYRVCMRKHIWIWGEKVLRGCIWMAKQLVLQSRL